MNNSNNILINNQFLYKKEKNFLLQKCDNILSEAFTAEYSPVEGYSKNKQAIHIFLPEKHASSLLKQNYISELPGWFKPVLKLVNAATMTDNNFVIITSGDYVHQKTNTFTTVTLSKNEKPITILRSGLPSVFSCGLYFYNGISKISHSFLEEEAINIIFKQSNSLNKTKELLSHFMPMEEEGNLT
jgi:hypothetical protein